MFASNVIPYIAFIFLAIVHNVSPQILNIAEGNQCSMSNGDSGTCKKIADCPAAVDLIKQQSNPPICSFIGKDPVVCCPADKPALYIQKCAEYGKKVFKMSRPQIPLLGAPLFNESLCGHTAKPMIVGGEKAAGREFPHMALLGYGAETDIIWSCGGTLISENFVLTAAHCLSGFNGDVQFVRLGELSLTSTTDDADPQNFNVIERIKHPNFTPPDQYNDIALLKLDRNIKITGYVRPACLYGENKNPEKMIATGWGAIEFQDVSSNDLLKVTLLNYNYDICAPKYKKEKKLPRGIATDTHLCAGGGAGEEKDTCQGDSGGPLQIYHPTVYCMYSVVGVTSLGKACGTPNFPGLYTKVSAFIPWIEKEVWGGK